MSTESTNVKAAEQAKGNGSDGFVDIVLDYPTFKGEAFCERIAGTQDEAYKGPAIEGLLVGSAEFEMTDEQTGELRTITSYVIELTKACKGFDRGATTARDVKAGEQLRVVQTAILKQALPEKVANHPTQALLVRITPTFRKPQPKDANKKMWHYKVATGGIKARGARNMDHVAQLLASVAAPQLAS